MLIVGEAAQTVAISPMMYVQANIPYAFVARGRSSFWIFPLFLLAACVSDDFDDFFLC